MVIALYQHKIVPIIKPEIGLGNLYWTYQLACEDRYDLGALQVRDIIIREGAFIKWSLAEGPLKASATEPNTSSPICLESQLPFKYLKRKTSLIFWIQSSYY